MEKKAVYASTEDESNLMKLVNEGLRASGIDKSDELRNNDYESMASLDYRGILS